MDKLQDLIDTQWNVNLTQCVSEFTGFTDLIDTQWNVNKSVKIDDPFANFDLIDTQWNVNTIRDGIFLSWDQI